MQVTTAIQSGTVALAEQLARESFRSENTACAARVRAYNHLFDECDRAVSADLRPDRPVPDTYTVAAARLGAATGMPSARARAQITFAVEMVDRFPTLLSAMDRGLVDERTAQMVVRHLRTSTGPAHHGLERRVVGWLVGELDGGGRPGLEAIRSRIDEELGAADPEALDRRRQAARQERSVTVRRREDGMSDVVAHLTATEASLLLSRIDAAVPAHSEPAARADALMALLTGGAEVTLRPEVTIVGATATLPGVGTVPYGQVVDLLTGSSATLVRTLDPAIGAGHRPEDELRYRPSSRLAVRVRLRDGTCRHPGCSVPARACDLDHVRPFDHSDPTRGGPTRETNLMCLCREHHRLKTFAGWVHRLAPDGVLTVVTDTGAVLTTHPTGPLAATRRVHTPTRRHRAPACASGRHHVRGDRGCDRA